ncbi:hypothetical protein PU630_10160 [Microbacterium horticulturae]|uniref:Uncharacterized protein n=1 Tax=Microbacterium horticulturae TaxID=3028316 RepID=A0ABY8BXP4_9MICO|nr:hypothetical protein [Microbacterium sp. KACC 23027]WEG07621.1 hypothetical protein PU630_10160 [Microbacterium sp. KACC 23027]
MEHSNNGAARRVGIRPLVVIATTGIAVGFALVIVSIGLDWHGFGGGFAVGAGVGMMLVGAYCWGYSGGMHRRASTRWWRPSAGGSR